MKTRRQGFRKQTAFDKGVELIREQSCKMLQIPPASMHLYPPHILAFGYYGVFVSAWISGRSCACKACTPHRELGSAVNIISWCTTLLLLLESCALLVFVSFTVCGGWVREKEELFYLFFLFWLDAIIIPNLANICLPHVSQLLSVEFFSTALRTQPKTEHSVTSCSGAPMDSQLVAEYRWFICLFVRYLQLYELFCVTANKCGILGNDMISEKPKHVLRVYPGLL